MNLKEKLRECLGEEAHYEARTDLLLFRMKVIDPYEPDDALDNPWFINYALDTLKDNFSSVTIQYLKATRVWLVSWTMGAKWYFTDRYTTKVLALTHALMKVHHD